MTTTLQTSILVKMDANVRKLVEMKVKFKLKDEIENLVKETNSSEPSEILKRLDLNPIVTEIAENVKKSSSAKKNPNEYWPDLGLDYCDYPKIIENLNSNSTMTKLKALDELLNYQIIDTKSKHWDELSQRLRRFFVSSNVEIFTRVLKIHYRIATFPPTSKEGYFNLLQGTNLLLHSRFFNEPMKLRIFNSLQVILHTQKFSLKALLHSNYRIINDIASILVEIVTFQSIIDIIASLDRKSEWLYLFCYGANIRKSIFHQLFDKSPQFLQNLIQIVVNALTGHQQPITKFDTLSHHCNFLGYLLSYKNNSRFFPCILEDKREINASSLLEILITRIQKGNFDGRAELIDVLVGTFDRNPSLININILNLLLRPLETTSVISNDSDYVFDIVTNLSKSSNSEILFTSCNKLKKSNRGRGFWRKSTNSGQIIVDLATNYLQDCIRQKSCDSLNSVVKLLTCCLHIYESHSVAFHHINPNKFLVNLHDFYVIKLGNECLRSKLLDLFKYFYSHYGRQSFNSVDNYLGVLIDLFSIPDDGSHYRDLKPIIDTVANEKRAVDLLKKLKLTKTHLDTIWYLEEDELNFFTLTHQVDDAVMDLLSLIFTLRFNYKATFAILNESDDDDDGTIVDGSNEKSTNLRDLIEKCLGDFQNSTEEYLGLLAVKVFSTNLDVMVYFEANYQMQEKLKTLQEFAKTNDGVAIVDAQSILRANILQSTEFVGLPKPELNSGITDGIKLPTYEPQSIVLNPDENSEFRSLINGVKSGDCGDFGWIHHARRVFKSSLLIFDPDIFADYLEKGPKTYVYRKINFKWPPPDCVYFKLHPEDLCAISVMIRFGTHSYLLQPSKNHPENLAMLIKQSRAILGHQPEEFTNFDWFLGLIYVIFRGDFVKCQKLLINLTDTHVVPLLWATFGKQFDFSLQENFYRQLPIVIEENCNETYQSLKMLGVSCDSVVRFWLEHTFFDILSVQEICNFWLFSLLHPPETILYFFVALFQHLGEKIRTNTHSPSLENLLQMTDLSGFRLHDHITAIEQLAKQYRHVHKL